MKKTSKKSQKHIAHRHFEAKVFLTIAVTLVLSTVVYFMGGMSSLYKASVISVPEHARFDGTTYPIKKVPNWVKLTSAQFKVSYGEIPSFIETPLYEPEKLKTLVANLKWGDPVANVIRNQKITYAVAYMAAYDKSNEELSGSHPAIDIKIPVGTPVFAIANGTVIKASTQSDGYGHHIVIQHNNFPTLENANAKTTIFSSYSHMSDINVSIGDVVKKGQQIGDSGQTGNATTPHLHFQIDNEEAPYHPFWPFTWKESSDAGLDFFSAVNAGLGKEKALQATINPMAYVQKYLNAEGGSSDSNTDNSSSNTSNSNSSSNSNSNNSNTSSNDANSYVDNSNSSTSNDTPSNPSSDSNSNITTDNSTATNNVPTTDDANTPSNPPKVEKSLVFDIQVQPKYYIGRNAPFVIALKDTSGGEWGNGFNGEAYVSSSDTNTLSVDGTILNIIQFSSDGIYKGNLRDFTKEGRYKLKVVYNGNTFYSQPFDIVANNAGEAISFTDLSSDNKYYTAVQYLAEKKIINGYPDGSFKPNGYVNRAEALKIILEGIDASLSKGKLPFKDMKTEEWYSKYVYTAYKKGVVEGNPDGTFKPNKTVNKAEFFKILLNGMDVSVDSSVSENPFSDVNKNEWYAPYFAKAKELKIIDAVTTKVNPSANMTRGEVAVAIYRLLTISDKKVASN